MLFFIIDTMKMEPGRSDEMNKKYTDNDLIAHFLSTQDPALLTAIEEAQLSCGMIEQIVEKHSSDQTEFLINLNKIAMGLESVGSFEKCTRLIQYALTISPSDSVTLRHCQMVCGKILSAKYQMNVVIATNRNYVHVACVMLYSLFYHNTDADIHVYVLNSELTEEDALLLERLADAWQQQIDLIAITDLSLFHDLPCTDAWTKETYFRLLLPDLLPDHVERILYLDVDIIIHQSVREFYTSDFMGKDLIVCEDILLNRVHKNYYYDHFYELKGKEFTYFNAGVILWNLAKTRTLYSFQTYRQKLLEHRTVLQCLDQDILNLIHCGQTVTMDWRRFNLSVPVAAKNDFSCEEVSSYCAIIHFSGPKPWDPSVPFQELYQIWLNYEQMMNSDNLSVR